MIQKLTVHFKRPLHNGCSVEGFGFIYLDDVTFLGTVLENAVGVPLLAISLIVLYHCVGKAREKFVKNSFQTVQKKVCVYNPV